MSPQQFNGRLLVMRTENGNAMVFGVVSGLTSTDDAKMIEVAGLMYINKTHSQSVNPEGLPLHELAIRGGLQAENRGTHK